MRAARAGEQAAANGIPHPSARRERSFFIIVTRELLICLVISPPDDCNFLRESMIIGFRAAVLSLHQTPEDLFENPQHTSDAATEDPEDNSSVEEFGFV
jgi:hypothetical protein